MNCSSVSVSMSLLLRLSKCLVRILLSVFLLSLCVGMAANQLRDGTVISDGTDVDDL